MKTSRITLTIVPLLLLGVALYGCSSSDSDKDQGVNTANNSKSDLANDTVKDDTATEEDQSTPPPAELGKPCKTPGDCTEPLFCALLSPEKGFCTKECTSEKKPCSGTPAGTVAYCIVKDPNTGRFGCAFICKHPQLGEQKCPDPLICPDTQTPPNSGQHLCAPE